LDKRSQLRAIIIIWITALVTLILGNCAAITIFLFGAYQGVKSFFSNAPTLVSLGPLALGCGLQLLLVFLFVGVRDRFENRCWELIKADGGKSDEKANVSVLDRQAQGRDDRLAAVQERRSRQFSKRLRVLIEYAWPRPPP